VEDGSKDFGTERDQDFKWNKIIFYSNQIELF
jgi:hypothetical protein